MKRTPEGSRIAIPETGSWSKTVQHYNLFIRKNGKHKKIFPDSILFAQANGSYLILHTDSDQFTISRNLRQFMQKSPLPNLLRVHRSYLININKVEAFNDSHIFIGKEQIPFSETYRSDFLKLVHCI